MRYYKKSIIIFGVTILLLFPIAIFIKNQYVAPILMYHSVNPSPHPQKRVEISVESFKRQMSFLKNNKYNVVPLETIARLIGTKSKIPPKTVAITFDDGYKDNYIYAFAVLKKYDFPATIFVIINEVGRINNETKQYDRLNWDEIREMADTRLITIGSHTLGPEPLINIQSEEQLRREIFDSRKILEKKLGRRVDIFSYPGGFFNPKIKQLVFDAGYSIAVATNPGKKFPNNDVLALKRLRISSSSNNLFVFWLESSGFYNFIREHRKK